jgi:hypothetical protein
VRVLNVSTIMNKYCAQLNDCSSSPPIHTIVHVLSMISYVNGLFGGIVVCCNALYFSESLRLTNSEQSVAPYSELIGCYGTQSNNERVWAVYDDVKLSKQFCIDDIDVAIDKHKGCFILLNYVLLILRRKYK